MKRLFHKNKRTDSSVSQPQTPSPAPHDAQTPSPQPPNSHGASPSPQGQAQQQQYQQQQFQQQGYNPQQWQGQLPQGPPGQQYVLVPVPVEALHQQQQRPGLPRPPRVQDVGNAIGAWLRVTEGSRRRRKAGADLARSQDGLLPCLRSTRPTSSTSPTTSHRARVRARRRPRRSSRSSRCVQPPFLSDPTSAYTILGRSMPRLPRKSVQCA